MKSVMYKLALFFLVIAYCNAKLVEKYFKDISVGPHASDKVVHEKVCLSDSPKDVLWVLDLNDDELSFKRLRSADKMDRRVFREAMEPAIKNYQYRHLSEAVDTKSEETKPPPKTDLDMDTEFITKYDVKKLIMRMFNKFIMPFQGEPNLQFHLGDNNKVSIKVYFKGPFSSLIVRYKNKRWNYFIEPPSPLPRWFYEKHTNATRSGRAMFVDVPDSVRNEFYGKFFNILQLFFSYAL